MKNNDKKEYKVYLTGLKQWVEVTRQQYLDFYREIWAYQKRAKYHGKCNCPLRKLWLCDTDCFTCSFQTVLDDYSLDALEEDFEGKELFLTKELIDYSADLQAIVEDAELLETLLAKLQLLTCEEREICKLLLEGKTEREITLILGFTNQSAVNYRKNRAFKSLKDLLAEYL